MPNVINETETLQQRIFHPPSSFKNLVKLSLVDYERPLSGKKTALKKPGKKK